MDKAKPTNNRADEIRRRRSERSPQPAVISGGRRKKARTVFSTDVTRRSEPKRSGPPAPPPVMARGSAPGSSAAESRRVQRARRTYRIALDSQGAEMRLPSLPHIQFGWRLASFLIAGLLIFGLYTLWNAPLYRVSQETLQISGLQRLSEASVRNTLAVEDKPVFILDTQAMQANLLANFPEFSAAAIAIQLPNTVVVTVTERVPVLIWRQDGHSNLIDMDGMAFPLRDENVQMNLVIVEASAAPPAPAVPENEEAADEEQAQAKEKDSAPVIALPGSGDLYRSSEGQLAAPARPLMFPEMVSAILSLAAKAPEGAVLTYDAQHGLGWKDQRGWEVYFGNVLEVKNGDIEMKLRVYKSILDYLKAQDTKPALISVEYVHAPYYRLASASGE